MKKRKAVAALTVSVLLLCASQARAAELEIVYSPQGNAYGMEDLLSERVPLSQPPTVFNIPIPVATGENGIRNYAAEIDVSNTKDGYIMVRYLRKTDKALKVTVKGPSGTPYIYALRNDGQYEVFPVSDGDGYYQITVYENVFDNKYIAVLGTTRNVQMEDEFAPFIRPNQYVNYNSGSKTTLTAARISQNTKSVTGKITAIYNYVTRNIVYDTQLAATVQAGYIPDVDMVLESGKGICFDYAAVTTAMLRSQGIPAKLVVGYRGSDYHAWVSVYSGEPGWVDSTIYLDGKSWVLIDPTLDSGGGRVFKNAGDVGNYCAKYFY